MKNIQAYLLILMTIILLPVQGMADQAVKPTKPDLNKITTAAKVVQQQAINLAHQERVTIDGKGIPFDVPMQQFDCSIVENSCVCSVFFSARYKETDEYRNLLFKIYPALISRVEYETDNARLAFSGLAGFMESASEDSKLVSPKVLEKELKSQDETMTGYISFMSPENASRSSSTVTKAIKDLVTLCGGHLAAR